ncbi:1,2-phenylacetyl-CoA epoxidase subunit PaaC [Mesohalobacter halotolerans]|uniref:Phenylacetate-CoA oxygenase subunit PaaC n=1 Tax=Mesohalobacter halotolerans TaxID=1883405 RepID=A0A4U5TQ82_9FLAO|nr:1,2-phenylacetyl-CoA epoxidase subunit PaaC [Mesohalobacter halotolerans]TKS56339.1 phenylacetate-CoA oxygenase subunit PaaC [Mesohalobacter halotolerans]
MTKQNLIHYIYGIADNALILGQRLSELCGHGPTLETDIALTNIALDLLGQTRSYYQYISNLTTDGSTEDDVAFLRKERQYRNVLLVEQPNTDFAYIIVRQYFYDVFHYMLLQELQLSKDVNLTAIADKSIKEVGYHQQFSGDWVKRLGDGTSESHDKTQQAVNDLWVFTEELFHLSNEDKIVVDSGHGINPKSFKDQYFNKISTLLEDATIKVPESKYFQKGGKDGIHSEHMGYILAEMQYMQRTYPDMKW